jgi:adenosylmethionine-8-amino-7-oxononanoate aminotransferase
MNDLIDEDKKYIWHPFTPLEGGPTPIPVVSGKGVYLITEDGRRIIDAVSSWWVNLHGHGNEHLADAIARQAAKLEHVIFAGFTHEPAITLAKNLLSILPENQSKVFFSDNGSTAVEVALKMSFQYWHNLGIRKRKVIALNGAYHGDTFGSMSVGERGLFTTPFDPYLFDVQFIDFPDGSNEQHILKTFQDLISSNEVGAFIFEPLVQAAAGMRMYPAKLLDKLITMAHEKDVLCIADEVFTGFGRTGKNFASDHLNHKPDILAVSKGITGGALPLGVTSCSEKIVNAYRSDELSKTFFHGHSYTANPIACAAANASFELLMREDCQQSIQRISRLHEGFREAIRNNKHVKEARCCGTILAIELKHEEGSSYTNSIWKKIYPYFLERNILLRPLGNVIYILPPYITGDDELKILYSAIEKFLETM